MSQPTDPTPTPPQQREGKLPPEVAAAIRHLTPYLEKSGVAVPKDLTQAVPQIHLGDRVGELAHALAQHLRSSGLYRAGEELVTVDEGTGRFQIMKSTYVNDKQQALELLFKEITGQDHKIIPVEPIGFEFSEQTLLQIAPKKWLLEKIGIDSSLYPEIAQPDGVAPQSG